MCRCAPSPAAERPLRTSSGVPETVTFTPDGSRVQTFSLTATDDDDDVDDGRTAVLSFGALPPGLASTFPQSTVVSLIDDDTDGIVLSSTSAAVSEGGVALYTVRLATAPSETVTVSIDVPPGDLSATPGALTFAPATWSTARSVTLSAAADLDAIRDAPVTVAHAATGGGADTAYEGLTGPVLTVTITEDDTPALSVADAVVGEGDGTVEFTVLLDRITDRGVHVDYETKRRHGDVGVGLRAHHGILAYPGRRPLQHDQCARPRRRGRRG